MTSSWNKVTVYATWENYDLSPKAGTWTASIPVRVTNATDDVIFPAGTFASGSLDTTVGHRSLSFQCFATDDPDNDTQGFQVTITVKFADGSATEVYIIPIPLASAGTGLNLRAVTLPQFFPPPQPVLVKGIPNGIAPLDADGDVNDASGQKILPGGGGGSTTVDGITDATAVGKLVLKSANAAAVRSNIGAAIIGSIAGTALDAADPAVTNARTPTASSVNNSKVAGNANIDASKINLSAYFTSTQVTAAIAAAVATSDAMIYKGPINCSANPNYPAADNGWTYKISVAGKIGGASGDVVSVGDMLVCKVDGSASGTKAAVGANWDIFPNTAGIVGPPTSVAHNLAAFSNTSGSTLEDAGVPVSSLVLATDPALTDARPGVFPAWVALTAYEADQVVRQSGRIWSAKIAFTSGASFSAANWNDQTQAILDLIVAADISDSSAIGREILTDVDAAAVRASLNLGAAALQPLNAFDAAGTAGSAVSALAGTLGTASTHAAGDFLGSGDAGTPRPGVLKSFIASHAYAADEAIRQSGNIYTAKIGFTSGASFNVNDWNLAAVSSGGGGGTIVGGRGQYLTVASSQMPSDAAALCDYVCDGVNDQLEINAALLRASRPGDGFGGEGYAGVALVGPGFFTAQAQTGPGTGAITIYPGTRLQGAGMGTLISPMWATNVDRGAIELLGDTTDHCEVANLSIGRPNAVNFNGHGLKFSQNHSGSAFELKTAQDSFIRITAVAVLHNNGHSMWITGPGGTGNARGVRIENCLFVDPGLAGLWDDGSSDMQVINCKAEGGVGVGWAHYMMAGGNSKVSASKSSFSDADAYLCTSSRVEVTGCAAQDAGRYGFNVSGSDVSMVSCIADSNMRLNASQGIGGAGFLIASPGIYEGLHMFDRAETPTSRQTKGIVFSGAPQNVFLTGRSNFNSTGSPISTGVAITSAPGIGSYARMLRVGGTDSGLYSVG